MSWTVEELDRLRALPYAERSPRVVFRGESHFTPCTPCAELMTGRADAGVTAANHRCWKTNGVCACDCAVVVG